MADLDTDQDTDLDQDTLDTPSQPPASAVSAVPEPKVLRVPVSQMGAIKKAERERGRREALAQMDQQAQSLGYTDWAELAAAKVDAATRRAKPVADDEDESPAPAATRAKAVAPKAAPQANTEELSIAYRRANTARAEAERENRLLRKQLESTKAETSLRVAASQAGVVDVDYAVTVLRRQLAGKTQADLAKFDAPNYFKKDLKRSHPFLYVAAEELPTTSSEDVAASEAAQPAPVPSASAPKRAPTRGPVDAMKMSRTEFAEHLRTRNLSSP